MKIKNLIPYCLIFQFCFALTCSQVVAAGQNCQAILKQSKNVSSVENLSPEEKKWFEKFQEGTFYAKGWKEITEEILRKTPEHFVECEKAALESLGMKIGFEWSKDNETRKIDTKMLQKWGRMLEKTANENPDKILEAVADIDHQVTVLLD